MFLAAKESVEEDLTMKKFKEMIEQVKKDGILNNKSSSDIKLFFASIEHCHPFVFYPTGNVPQEAEGDDDAAKYSSPFTVWSAEILGDHAISIHGDGSGSILCFMAVEPSSPTHTKTLYYVHMKVTKPDGSILKAVVLVNDLGGIPQKLIERLNSNKETFGNENARHRIRVGSGKEKRVITIRNIIYVKPKKFKATENNNEPRIVEWRQRWWVRGAWHYFWLNKDAGIIDESRPGKCREGCYCQQGRTWHIEHLKGDESLPVENKVRVVKPEN